jgi:hypothetical protein
MCPTWAPLGCPEKNQDSMKRLFPVIEQSLIAALFVLMGFSVYGCGGEAAVTPGLVLANLTITPGTLEPDFSGTTTQYNVDLSSDITSVSITAQPLLPSDTVQINGQTTTSLAVPLDAAGTTTTVRIVVSESNGNSTTYFILAKRAPLDGNNSLQNLSVAPGTLTPTFDMNHLAYTISVPNTVGSVSVTPTLSEAAATMIVNGQAATSGQGRSVTLKGPGEDTTISIVVTAQNGREKSYTITVSRGVSNNSKLGKLVISPGTLSPVFSAGTTGYKVNVPSTVAGNVTSVTVTPTLQDTTATMTVNGQAATSGQAKTTPLPAPGSSVFINIVVTAQNKTQTTYSINVSRAALGGNNNLSALTVTSGTLAPAFSANTTNYTVDVGSGVASVTVTATVQASTASLTVNGQATPSGQGRSITLNGAGSDTAINIVVTAQNNTQKIYSVTVERAALSGNNNLSALTVTSGTLAPAFSANTTAYSVDVGSGVTSVTVTATVQNTNATLTIEGQGTSSGQGRSISLGAAGTTTAIDILVTAPNGRSKSYTINVRKAASSDSKLSTLTATVGTTPLTLSPAFDSGMTTYTAEAGATDSVTVSATKADPNAVMSAQGSVIARAGTPTGQVTIAPPGTEVVIAVSAQDQASTTQYTITVNRAAAAPPSP